MRPIPRLDQPAALASAAASSGVSTTTAAKWPYLGADGVLNSVAVGGEGDRFGADVPRPLFATGIPMQRVDEQPE